jgi:hypothetical protein
MLDPNLLNKCISFTLPSIDCSQLDSATIIYNSMNISKEANKNNWNQISCNLASSHMEAVKISENNLDQMAGGIKITPRNLTFLTTDRNKNKFKDNDVKQTVKWLKSVLTFYYFNSFIDLPQDKIKDKQNIFTKKKFEEKIYKKFTENKEVLDIGEDLREEQKFPEIVKILIEIQKSNPEYNFKFGDFVKKCLDVKIEKENLEYIKNQIEDTLKLLDYSNLKEEKLYSFYQIKIIERFYRILLENIDAIKVENKGQPIRSDDLLRLNALKPILLKFRLLELLTNNDEPNFGYKMITIFYDPNINQLISKINNLIYRKDKLALKEFISFCREYHYFIKYIETIFPFNKFNEKSDKDFEIGYYYIELMIELYRSKTNFVFLINDEEISFKFEEKQYKRLFPILILNEKDNIYLSKGTYAQYLENIKNNDSEKKFVLIEKQENVTKDSSNNCIKFLIKYSNNLKKSQDLQNFIMKLKMKI